jgi:hypothetical protein
MMEVGMRLGEQYPLLTRLSAAIYAGDISYAETVLQDALWNRYEPSVINSIVTGKRVARPDPQLPPDEDQFRGINEGDDE